VQLRAAYGLPINSYRGVYSVEIRLDDVANRCAQRDEVAATEGAGLLGRFAHRCSRPRYSFRHLPCYDSELSLLYGLSSITDEETADLWVAAASAAG